VRIRRLILRGPESENPKAQGKPRAEGEKASHKPSRVLDGDSGARANHGSGRLGPVTGCILPAAAGFSAGVIYNPKSPICGGRSRWKMSGSFSNLWFQLRNSVLLG
jgi:hypothetical protein